MNNIKKKELAIAIGKGIIGALPYVGPVLSEVINTLIPNQRIERFEKFLIILEAKLEALKNDSIINKLKEQTYIDLFEDGVHYASRALSSERINYIASLIKNSLTDEEMETVNFKRLLSILGELNDIEVIILTSYSYKYSHDSEFWNKHEDLLTVPVAHTGSSKKEIDRYTIYSSYRAHLVRLQLLSIKFDRPKKGDFPKFDEKTGMIKATGHELTSLGRLLLKKIDLIEKY